MKNSTITNVEFGVGGQITYGAGFNGGSSRIATGLTLPADSTMFFSFWLKSASNSSGNNYIWNEETQ